MKVRIINKSSNELPSYQTEASAGMDLRAELEEPVQLAPLERAVIGTGLIYGITHGI